MAEENVVLAYKIKFHDNTHAILAERLFEEEHEVPNDAREGNTLYFSKEWWDKAGTEKEDFEKWLEDICCIGEMDYTPEVEIVKYDFETEINYGYKNKL